MIFFTTFILTLLFAHITRAVPGCDDDVYPDEVYDPIYDDGQKAFQPDLPVKVTWDPKYDNPNGNTFGIACSTASPRFKDIPQFPFIGGKSHIRWRSPQCGGCWKLTYKKTGDHIHITVIDSAVDDNVFDISKYAFKKLNGGSAVPGTIHAEAHQVSHHPCKP